MTAAEILPVLLGGISEKYGFNHKKKIVLYNTIINIHIFECVENACTQKI
jgi:hypothetical protein